MDLREWSSVDGNGDWVVGEDRLSVVQTRNGAPTFFCSPFDAFETDLTLQLSVNAEGDDDWISVALGYDQFDYPNNTHSHYLIVDWKQKAQDLGGPRGCGGRMPAREGFAVSRVRGNPTERELGSHIDTDTSVCREEVQMFVGTIEELARGINYNNTGWAPFQVYSFRFKYTKERLQVFVNGELELDVVAPEGDPFPSGGFCFYNFSQQYVRYSGIERVKLPAQPICA